LHLLNLAGFPLVGFSAYLLTDGVNTPAAILSRTAAAIFIPIYAGFDALMGIGTGTLVKVISTLSPDQTAAFEPILDAYWNSGTIMATAVVGSIAWTISLLSAAVALTVRERRWLFGLASFIIFFVIGWARTNLMSGDGGTISTAWWIVLGVIGGQCWWLANRGYWLFLWCRQLSCLVQRIRCRPDRWVLLASSLQRFIGSFFAPERAKI
jgi:hypothetical protein